MRPVTTASPRSAFRPQAILGQLRRHRVLIPQRREVARYLNKFRRLARLLPSVCAKTRKSFDSDVELSLEVYVDPEIDDRYLTLYVRQRNYSLELIRQIDQVRATFDPALDRVPGYFLLTTDFRRPSSGDAV